MSTITKTKVEFTGVDFVVETQKSERGSQKRKERRKKKKAKKMAESSRRSKCCFFLMFLKTYAREARHEKLTDIPGSLGLLHAACAFLPSLRVLQTDGERLRAVDGILESGMLPEGTKTQRKAFCTSMNLMASLWKEEEEYSDIEEFFQELCRENRDRNLHNLFRSSNPAHARQLGGLATALQRSGVLKGVGRDNRGLRVADLDAANQRLIRELKENLVAANADDVSSSSDETAESDVYDDGRLHMIFSMCRPESSLALTGIVRLWRIRDCRMLLVAS